MIVHINGMPGTGKLTVARLLAARLGAELLDNHSVIDHPAAECSLTLDTTCLSAEQACNTLHADILQLFG